MEEFNELQKVINLFQNVGCYGNNNNIFIACKDMRKSSGLVGGMEYPFEGVIINHTDSGIGMFYLKQPGLVLTQNVSKMLLDKNSYIFIPNSNIKKIKIKNYALLNSKVKSITIDTNDGRSYKLFARLNEKGIPYQNDNLLKFINSQL